MLLITVIIISQLLFTTSDLVARHYMSTHGFKATTFLAWWFLLYVAIRTFATFGQLYVFTQMEVGKTMALFAASSLILMNVLGFLILKEQLSLPIYAGIALAVCAILIIGISK